MVLANLIRNGFLPIGYGPPIIFVLMILFIQEGWTYYISIQMSALFFLAGVMLYAGLIVRVTPALVAALMLFSVLLFCTVCLAPDTISQNSPNIVVTSIGVLGYVTIMLSLISLRPIRADWLLLFYRRSSAMIVAFIFLLVVLTDLGVIPGLTREYFHLQNVDLITNYSSMNGVLADIDYRTRVGIQSNIDLFYGEPSFLSLVLFVSLVCHVTSSRVLHHRAEVAPKSFGRYGARGVFVPLQICGIACLIHIQSLSSLVYVAVLLGFFLVSGIRSGKIIRLTPNKVVILTLLLLVVVMVAIENFPYYWHRITTFSDSISAQQRFGILFDFFPQDFLLGLHEPTRVPAAGFHNGLIYLVMMSGIGGICVIVYQLAWLVSKGRRLEVGTLCMLAVLAAFSQNGAIFSPNKLIILSFVFLPLACFEQSFSKKSALLALQ